MRVRSGESGGIRSRRIPGTGFPEGGAVRTSIRAARAVPMVALLGAPLSFALLDSRARWNKPVSATRRGAVRGGRWG